MKALFRSLTARLFFSHMLVAILTGAIVTAVMLLILWSSSQRPTLESYEGIAFQYGIYWLAGLPSDGANEEIIDPASGWTVIVSPDNTVLWSRGDTPCRAGMALADCASDFVAVPASKQFFTREMETGHEQWAEIVTTLVTGDRLIMQRGPITSQPLLDYSEIVIYGYRDLMLWEILSRGMLALPVALILVFLIARPQLRRIAHIARISRKFAEGDLTTRVNDPNFDEVGRLARQFDDMADALAQNIYALRDLAQRNAELAIEAETAAIQAERARFSRDLHDAIAQRLFSLSVSTASLPTLIAQDQAKGVRQAQLVAELAEQTQQDLRALLIELRPMQVLQHGFTDALNSLCEAWQTAHHIPVETSLMLNGTRLSSPLEDTLYRITQEALHNVAKHAGARCVQVSLVQGQQHIRLSISDDGGGFDPEATRNSGRFGLMTMRERAESLGGQLHIESEVGHGTTILASVPLQITE